MSVTRGGGLVCLCTLLAGCGREANSAAPPGAPAAEQASPRGAVRLTDALSPAPLSQDNNDISATLQQLTAALRDYVVRTRTVPKTFEEFATKSQAQFPQPPPGKKYAIKGQEVVLEKH